MVSIEIGRVQPIDSMHSVATTSPSVLEELAFRAPVRFRVSGSDVFAATRADRTTEVWSQQALLGFATAVRDTVSSLKPGDRRDVAIGDSGTLTLERRGDLLSIRFNTSSMSHHAPWEEVRRAFSNFAERVRLLLLRECPAIRRHPEWPRWFPDG